MCARLHSQEYGLRAIVIPHGHTNLEQWSTARTVRPQLRGVGFVYMWPKSLPHGADLRMLTRVVCSLNATFYVVKAAGGKPMHVSALPCPNASSISVLSAERRRAADEESGAPRIAGAEVLARTLRGQCAANQTRRWRPLRAYPPMSDIAEFPQAPPRAIRSPRPLLALFLPSPSPPPTPPLTLYPPHTLSLLPLSASVL